MCFTAGIIPGTGGSAGVFDREKGVWTACGNMSEAVLLAGRLNASVNADATFVERAVDALTWVAGPEPERDEPKKDFDVVYIKGVDTNEDVSVVQPRHLFSNQGGAAEPRTLMEAAAEAFRLVLNGDGHAPAIVRVSDGTIVIGTTEFMEKYDLFEQAWRTPNPQP